MILVDGFAIDVATKIAPTFTAKATSHPIERGSNASDHLIDDPNGLSMDCIVSDSPSGEMVSIRAAEPGVPSANAMAKMLTLKREKKIITVSTKHRTYKDMVLLAFTPTFDRDTGEALRFTLVFQLMTLVQNDRQFVKVATPGARKLDARGNKAAKKPPEAPADAKADRNSSVLWKIINK